MVLSFSRSDQDIVFKKAISIDAKQQQQIKLKIALFRPFDDFFTFERSFSVLVKSSQQSSQNKTSCLLMSQVIWNNIS